MSPFAWLIIFFFILCFLVLLVYVLVVRAFYWGDKKEAPKYRTDEKVKREKGEKGKSFVD